MTATSPDLFEAVLGTPAAIAHDIRDRVSALANALEVIRSTPDRAAALRLAARQLDALARLGDAFHDPARYRLRPETPGRAARLQQGSTPTAMHNSGRLEPRVFRDFGRTSHCRPAEPRAIWRQQPPNSRGF